MDKITVVLADNHEVVRKGLRSALTLEDDIEVVGEASDGLELAGIAKLKKPKIVILDFVMPNSGVSAIKRLVNDFPEIGIIVFSLYDNEVYVISSLEAGAKSYVLKESSIDELVRAIRNVAKGKRYLSNKLSQIAIDAFIHHTRREKDVYSTLTHREKEVLKLLAEGLSNIEVAQKLSISKRTVEIHRANLMRKLNLRPQYVQLVDYASELGIVPPTEREPMGGSDIYKE